MFDPGIKKLLLSFFDVKDCLFLAKVSAGMCALKEYRPSRTHAMMIPISGQIYVYICKDLAEEPVQYKTQIT